MITVTCELRQTEAAPTPGNISNNNFYNDANRKIIVCA